MMAGFRLVGALGWRDNTHPIGLQRSRSQTVLTKNTIEELDRFL